MIEVDDDYFDLSFYFKEEYTGLGVYKYTSTLRNRMRICEG
jgi:hypothetical protein